MGILNVTPDSFSDGGEWNTVEKAVAHALEMVADGADIIDIGGESTRPGHTQISDEEEIARIVPVIEALKKAVDVPLSIDTYKSAVARAACEAGIDI
ncbi:MAG TPA: dihydropteroate synthase, partial [Trichococcus flocculiformis]|nr:dihydropteroate synthase [Trichococcus flocculiformis]